MINLAESVRSKVNTLKTSFYSETNKVKCEENCAHCNTYNTQSCLRCDQGFSLHN